MSYIQDNLSKGENIVYKGKLTPMIWGWPIVWYLIITYTFAKIGWGTGYAAIGAIAGLSFFLYPLIVSESTEIAITDKRVIIKTGLLSCNAFELNLVKVESVQVRQGFFGQMFNYGTVCVNGTGSSSQDISGIDRPLEFKKVVNKILDGLNGTR